MVRCVQILEESAHPPANKGNLHEGIISGPRALRRIALSLSSAAARVVLGALAKYIVVIPERDLVVVYQNHTALPDNAQSLSAAEVKKLPTISKSQMSTLLDLIPSAQQDEHR